MCMWGPNWELEGQKLSLPDTDCRWRFHTLVGANAGSQGNSKGENVKFVRPVFECESWEPQITLPWPWKYVSLRSTVANRLPMVTDCHTFGNVNILRLWRWRYLLSPWNLGSDADHRPVWDDKVSGLDSSLLSVVRFLLSDYTFVRREYSSAPSTSRSNHPYQGRSTAGL